MVLLITSIKKSTSPIRYGGGGGEFLSIFIPIKKLNLFFYGLKNPPKTPPPPPPQYLIGLVLFFIEVIRRTIP
jgi:hypothetical protein